MRFSLAILHCSLFSTLCAAPWSIAAAAFADHLSLQHPVTTQQFGASSHPHHINLDRRDQNTMLQPLVQGLAATIQQLKQALDAKFADELHEREQQQAKETHKKKVIAERHYLHPTHERHVHPPVDAAHAKLVATLDQMLQLASSEAPLDSPQLGQLLNQAVAIVHTDPPHTAPLLLGESHLHHQALQEGHSHYGPPPNLMFVPPSRLSYVPENSPFDVNTIKKHLDHGNLGVQLPHAGERHVSSTVVHPEPHPSVLGATLAFKDWQHIDRYVPEMNQQLTLSYRYRSSKEMQKNPHMTPDGRECRGQGGVEVIVNQNTKHCHFVDADKFKIVKRRFFKISYLKNANPNKKGCLADLTSHYLVLANGYRDIEPIHARFDGNFRRMAIVVESDQYVWEFEDVLAYLHLFNIGNFKLTLANPMGNSIVIERRHRSSRVRISSCPAIQVQSMTSGILKHVTLNAAENALSAVYDLDANQTCVTRLTPEVAHILKIFNKEGKIHLAVTHSSVQRVPLPPAWTTIERQTEAGLSKLAWRFLSPIERGDIEHIDSWGRHCNGAGPFEIVINDNPRKAFVTDKDRLALILHAHSQAPFLLAHPPAAPLSGIIYDHNSHLIIDTTSVYYYHQMRAVYDDDPDSTLIQFKNQKFRWKPNPSELPAGTGLYEYLLDEKSGAVKLAFKSSNPLEVSFVIEQDYDGDITLRAGDKITDFDYDDISNAITDAHLDVAADKILGKYKRDLSKLASVSLSKSAISLLKHLVIKTGLPIKIH